MKLYLPFSQVVHIWKAFVLQYIPSNIQNKNYSIDLMQSDPLNSLLKYAEILR